jgi:hypothetical protein
MPQRQEIIPGMFRTVSTWSLFFIASSFKRANIPVHSTTVTIGLASRSGEQWLIALGVLSCFQDLLPKIASLDLKYYLGTVLAGLYFYTFGTWFHWLMKIGKLMD